MRSEKRSLLLCLLAFGAALGLSSPSLSAGLELIRGTDAPIILEQEELAQLGPEQIQFGPHDAQPSSYTCVSLTRILQKAGVPSGEALRGAELRKIALVEASDDYTAAFSLGELDDALGEDASAAVLAQGGQAARRARGCAAIDSAGGLTRCALRPAGRAGSHRGSRRA